MKVLRILMILGVIALGFYVGLYLTFIKGIFDIVNGAMADLINVTTRITFALMVAIAAWALIIFGMDFIKKR